MHRSVAETRYCGLPQGGRGVAAEGRCTGRHCRPQVRPAEQGAVAAPSHQQMLDARRSGVLLGFDGGDPP